jgi:hypothetical protein
LRNHPYTDFIEAASRLVSARRSGNDTEEVELLAKLTDAKARICIYGEETVIKHLAAFFAAGATFETESGILTFTRFCLDIRRSVGITDSEILHPKWPSYCLVLLRKRDNYTRWTSTNIAPALPP